MPDGDLLVKPTQADPIPIEPLKIEPMREWYLADLKRLRLELVKLEALQAHGRLVCGWPAVGL